jgi:hypothetical protein
MRITMFQSDDMRVDPQGLSKDRRGSSGGAFGGRQGRQDDRGTSKHRAAPDEGMSIGSLLGQALGQYHGAGAFEYSM